MKISQTLQTARNNILLFLDVPARAIQNVFWTVIAACRYPGLYALATKQKLSATYDWLSQKWTALKGWFWNTWAGRKSNQLSEYISPTLRRIWMKIIKPMVHFGGAYSATIGVTLLIAALVTSITIPPAATIAIPIIVGIISAYFETKNNNDTKASAEAQKTQILSLETLTKTQKTDIQKLQNNIEEIKQLITNPKPAIRTNTTTFEEPLSGSQSTTPSGPGLRRTQSAS
jgi:hypothetical protein